jgi:hypothetical protein
MRSRVFGFVIRIFRGKIVLISQFASLIAIEFIRLTYLVVISLCEILMNEAPSREALVPMHKNAVGCTKFIFWIAAKTHGSKRRGRSTLCCRRRQVHPGIDHGMVLLLGRRTADRLPPKEPSGLFIRPPSIYWRPIAVGLDFGIWMPFSRFAVVVDGPLSDCVRIN